MTQIDTESGQGRRADKPILIAVALAAVTVFAYLPVLQNGFVGIDDDLFVVNNRHVQQGLSWEGVKWALTEHQTDYWHPLPWISHMLDVSMFGERAGGHHLTSLVLHISNALLLFGFLRYATRRLWASAFVAALFALHPLHVESVAWAAERKDVLSTLFFLATIWMYAAYAKKPGAMRYVAVVTLYALGLASKPMLVMLPFVLFLLDYWPLGRVRFEGWKARTDSGTLQRLAMEKVPLLVMAGALTMLTIVSQTKVTAIATLSELSVVSRLTNAVVSYWRYVQDMFWPVGLAVYYPLAFRPLYLEAAASLAFIVIVTIVVVRFSRRFQYLAVGWFWYLLTLLPVIGVIQAGHQSHADRYTYIPLTGLFIIMAWGIGDIGAAWPAMRKAVAVVGAVVLLAASVMTWRMVGYWKDDLSLYTRAVAVTKDNYFMLTSMAFALSDRGRSAEALECAEKAVKLRPAFGRAQVIMGSLLQESSRVEEALDYCKRGAELEPGAKDAQFNLALAYMRLGKTAEAEAYCRKAIAIDGLWPVGHDLLGLVLASEGKLDEAEASLRKAISLDPANADTYGKLAFVLEKAGRRTEAIEELKKALAIDPANERVRTMLGELSGNQK